MSVRKARVRAKKIYREHKDNLSVLRVDFNQNGKVSAEEFRRVYAMYWPILQEILEVLKWFTRDRGDEALDRAIASFNSLARNKPLPDKEDYARITRIATVLSAILTSIQRFSGRRVSYVIGELDTFFTVLTTQAVKP